MAHIGGLLDGDNLKVDGSCFGLWDGVGTLGNAVVVGISKIMGR